MGASGRGSWHRPRHETAVPTQEGEAGWRAAGGTEVPAPGVAEKVGHLWWNRPRVYRHDLADEREPAPPVQSVVVIQSDPDQPEASPEPQEPGPLGSVNG